MADVRVLVLRAAGINCDEEVMHCWRLAGAEPTLVHLNALVDRPVMLGDYQIVTIPGGFSYGDDISAGAIFAQRISSTLADPLQELVDRGGGILGICNGFQILVKAGLLPGELEGAPSARAMVAATATPDDPGRSAPGATSMTAGGDIFPALLPQGGERGTQHVTVTYNDSARFEARWVRLKVCTKHCVFLQPGAVLELPVEHAEGKVVAANAELVQRLERRGRIALRYVDEHGDETTYPANPNGSVAGIAGLCDSTGRIFGLMPHPDRHFERTQHPCWTKRSPRATPDGLTVFQNAVRYWKA